MPGCCLSRFFKSHACEKVINFIPWRLEGKDIAVYIADRDIVFFPLIMVFQDDSSISLRCSEHSIPVLSHFEMKKLRLREFKSQLFGSSKIAEH